ncbi:Pycsar system effector family protein [Kitasatospora cineracea]|uniref:Pycsar system effector family protein n=1 Tax=Kitasatospora cineracea TaxID=88074 RepID=UPI0036B502F5
MSETEDGTVDASTVAAEAVLAARSAAVLVELQRADGKAAALCALSGGMLAAVMAADSLWHTGPVLQVVAVLSGCAFLAAAVAAALIALRPTLPQNRSLAELESFRSDRTAGNALTALPALDRSALAELEARRLWRLARIAERKFRAVRTSVDLVALAGTVTGIGLLISCIR